MKKPLWRADHVVDIGPGAGIHGGEIVAEGTPKQIMKNAKSFTGQYLSGKQSIAVPTKRRPLNNNQNDYIINGATAII